MEPTEHDRNLRQANADRISERAQTIGSELDVVITRCVWDLGQDYALQHAHRLDLFADDRTVRLYFPDAELTAPENDTRARRTEERLRSAIAQLVTRAPAPTYSFR